MPRSSVLRQHDTVVRQRSPRVGVYPGSFNPLTVAHVEIARVARETHDLDVVRLIVSRVALDKESPAGPTFRERIAALQTQAETTPWLEVDTTDKQLIADIAEGYDVVIMGADKWYQLHEERYYDSPVARDAAVARLPTTAIAPRTGYRLPDGVALAIDERFWGVSSTLARTTRPEFEA